MFEARSADQQERSRAGIKPGVSRGILIEMNYPAASGRGINSEPYIYRRKRRGIQPEGIKQMVENQIRYLKSPFDLIKLFLDVAGGLPGVVMIRRQNRIARAFSEKIMLVVTGVNQCAYCSYLHTQTALERGVTPGEVQKLLQGELANFPEDEAIGLVYAQHWADTKGNVSPIARKKVIDYYGEQKTKYIEFFIKSVYIGNMCSNTVYAFENDMITKKSKVRLFPVYLLCKPVAFFINMEADRMERSAASERRDHPSRMGRT